MDRIAEEMRAHIAYMMGVIAGIIALAIGYLVVYLSMTSGLEVADAIQLAILTFFAATAVITWRGYQRELDFKRSETYLDNAIELVERAKLLLQDKDANLTSDLLSWVSAARQISRANLVASRLTDETHKQIFQAEHDYQRHVFHDLLQINGQPLSAKFFVGEHDADCSFGKAALKSVEERSPSWIPPEIVSVIYRFAHYPKHYTDPLREEARASEQERTMFGIVRDRGVQDYLEFRDQYAPLAGRIWKKQTQIENGRSVTAEEIDHFMGELDTSGFLRKSPQPSKKG
jgi:hypothetical protein